QKSVPYAALLIRNESNQYMIEKRPENGLLANLWQFPMAPLHEIDEEHIVEWAAKKYGVSMELGEKAGSLKHVFSHLIWQIDIYYAWTGQSETTGDRIQFVHQEDLELYPFPVSHQKMMAYTES